MEERIVGKRPLERPRTRWKDVVEKYLIHKKVQIDDAKNVDRWNEIVVAAMDQHGSTKLLRGRIRRTNRK